MTKRLSKGVFQWPKDKAEAREMSREDFERFMDGYTVENSIRTFTRGNKPENEEDTMDKSAFDSQRVA